MKKKYSLKTLLFLFLFSAFALNLKASTFYWVGNSGLWTDVHHWSLSSGGAGGAGVPGMNDDVVFNLNSFSLPNETVSIPGTAICHSMQWTNDVYHPILTGGSSATLDIYGSFTLCTDVNWLYSGSIHFKSFQTGNTINTGGWALNSNVFFEGSGSWQINDNLILSNLSTLTISSGNINAAADVVQCGTLKLQGGAAKVLQLHNSVLIVKTLIDSTGSSNFSAPSSNSIIQYKNYTSVRIFSVFNSPSYIPHTPAIINPGWDSSSTHASCNCNDTAGSGGLAKCCNGKAVIKNVNSTNGGAPFIFEWSTGDTTRGVHADSVLNICSSLGSITCTIIDTSDLSSLTVVFNVNVSQIFIPIETPKSPRCNGECNGWITAQIAGGAPIYTYQWSSGNPGNGHIAANSNFTDSDLCVVGLASTFTISITDAHHCVLKKNFSVTQPKAITITLSSINEPCNGNCSGSATVTNTQGGHGAPYTYKWLPGNQTTTTINNLCMGTYTVTATDDSGCTGSASVTITQPPPLVMNPSQTNVTCNAACNGTASVAPTGGTPAYTYTWTPNVSSGPTATNLCAGNYKVVLKDADGCKDSASFIITQPPVLNAHLTFTNVDCNGNCDGTASVAPTGGTPAYTYLWSTGATVNNVNGLCAGVDWVKVTDSHGCFDSVSFTITQPPPIVLNPVSYNIKCHGSCTGAAAVHPTGGATPYTYLWTPTNNTTDSIGALCAGTYKVVVTDHNRCKDSVNITITQPPVISINITPVNVSCNGACNGSATANVSGGTPGYKYLWSNGRTTSAISPLCANSYTVTVTDTNGCTATASVIITQPNPLVVGASAIPNPLTCFGNCNATVTSSVSGGTAPYAYSWAPGGQITPSITNQCAGSYTVTVTDAHNCTASASITISQAPQLRDSIIAVTNVKCNGGSTGSATVGVKGGTPPYTYQWTPTGGTNPTANGLTAGSYTITVTDHNGCTATSSVVITQPPPLVLSISDTGEKCNGNINGKAVVSPSGGTPAYTYSWAPSGGTNAIASNLSVGCYTVTVTDANHCTATASTCITEPPPLAAIIGSTTSSCNICDGSAKVTTSGGTTPYTYSWNTVPVQTTDSATGLCIGTYTVTVKDAHGCTSTAQATITATVHILVTTSSNSVSCHNSCDGVATANPSGGNSPYTYSWTTIPIQTNQTATGLCAGSYTVTVTDANGCSSKDSLTLINPPQLTVNTTQTNATCLGSCNGTATANPAGGTGAYTYNWAPVGQNTQTATGLCSGTYTVTVTDANGCTATASVTITSNAGINDNPTLVQPTCGASNGSITLNPTGGTAPYHYLWAPPVSVGSFAGGLSAGTYTVTITDNIGCSQIFLIPLNNITGPTLTGTNTTATCADTCDGAVSVTVTSGAAPFTYLWSTGATTTSVTALCPGTYACAVKDNNGCITNINETVGKPVPISPNATVQNIPCNGANNGQITFAPTGGTSPYTYTWTPPVSVTNSASGLTQGIYTITIRDNVKCDTTINITITEPTALSVNITSTNITCNGSANGTATANVTGGLTPYIYSWSNGGVVSNIVNLTQGSYTVTVHDVNGCQATASVNITQPPPLAVIITPINVSCNLGSDGGANTSVSGGTPLYTYHWSNGETTSNLTNVPVGKYYLTITDANGCTLDDSVTITQPPPILISFLTQNTTCNGDCNGTATANASGGTSPYTYSWNTLPAQTNQTATGLCAGNYVVTVTDANHCTGSNNVTITQPPPLSPNVTTTPTSCPLACNGTATAAPTGGTGPYTYKWLPGNQTTNSVSGLCGGVYTLVVTDKNGCVDTSFVTVNIPVKLSISVSTSPSNCNASNGSITVTPSGGTPGYVYLWSPGGQTTPTVNGLAAGIYTVQVTDSKGCDSSFAVILNNTNGPSSFTNHVKDELCFGDSAGYIDANPNGGTPPYVFFWTNIPVPNGQGTDSIFNLKAATYTLQVTDNSGCIQFDTVKVTQPPVISAVAAITNAACPGVCNGSITVTASGGTAPYTYNWSSGGTTITVSNLCPGPDTVLITDHDGCTLKKVFIVGQNATITVVTTTTPVPCNGGNTGTATAIPSGGTPAYIYSWTPGPQITQTAINLTAGTYTVVVTDQNGCQGTDSAKVTQPPVLTINLNNTPITCNNSCDGKSVAVVSGGTAPYTYNWSSGETVDSITNKCAGKFVLTVKDAHGCTTMDSVTFINPPVMTESHILTNSSCNTTPDGDITIIVGGGITPYTFSWSNGATTQNLVNVVSGKYVLTLKDSTGCVIIDSITLPADTTVIANAGADTSFCVNDPTITLNGSHSINSIVYQWFQLPGNTLIGNTAIITIPTPPIGITKYMLVTKDVACVDTDTIAVTVLPPPVADAGPTKSIFINTSTTIGGSPTGPGGSTYHWSPPNGLGGDTNVANPVASPTVTTTYTVTVTGPTGCIGTDTVTVFILPQIVIPDGFTPNGDGQNDVWVIKNISLFPNAVVEIFNRWGEELFYSAGYKTPWNGTFNNEPLPIGTYYYIIDLHDPRFPKAYTGPVTIVR